MADTHGDGGMGEREVAERILRVAAYLNDAQPRRPAADLARERGWLGPEGEPTPDGRDLVDALMDQAGTRSVFRNL